MKISVVTITFNSQAHLEDTIRSVLNQGCPDLEYIIVDGGSTDGTLPIIEKYRDRISRFVSEPDRGISDAMNKGIRMATGDLIGIIHSDDLYAQGALQTVSEAALEYPGVMVFHGDMEHISERGAFIVKPPKGPVKETLVRAMPVIHPTCFVRREAYRRLGLFRLDLRIAMDYDLMARFALSGAEFQYIPQVLAIMRGGGASDRAAYKGFRECCQSAIAYGVSPGLARMVYAKQVLERGVGNALRATGLGALAGLYRKVAYPNMENKQ